MIGGKVLDASALAELARRRPAAFAWQRGWPALTAVTADLGRLDRLDPDLPIDPH